MQILNTADENILTFFLNSIIFSFFIFNLKIALPATLKCIFKREEIWFLKVKVTIKIYNADFCKGNALLLAGYGL